MSVPVASGLSSPPWLARIPRPLRPPFDTARRYTLHKFRKDIVAGLTVSVVEVPQAMAYALIAGVPPQYGLYTSIIQGVIGALLSSSEHMTTGPTNTQSLLIASAVHRFAGNHSDPVEYLNLVFMLTFLKGLIQLAFAAGKMGSLVRYVSRPVIAGLVSGAGLLILITQTPAALGLRTKGSDDLPAAISAVDRIRQHFDEFNPRSLAVAAGVIAVIYAGRRLSRFFPGALLAVILSATLVGVLHWTHATLPLIDPIPPGVPHLHFPWVSFKAAEGLLAGALALAIVGMLESVAIAKSIAAKTGEEIDPNQEFFAQGFKNTLTSFIQCIPGSGSFTRSALDYAAGAETRFAAVYNACFVALIVILLGREAGFIPRAALAGVLIVIAIGLVELPYILSTFKASRRDAAVCLATLLATLILPLEYAILLGVILNICLYLRTSSRLHIVELLPDPSGAGFREIPYAHTQTSQPIRLIQLEGDLFFGIADELSDTLTDLAASPANVIILRLRRIHSIDTSAAGALRTFITTLQSQNRHLLLAGLRPSLQTDLTDHGILQLLPEGHAFPSTGLLFGSLRQAVRQAEKLTGASLRDTAEAATPTAWNYSI